LDAEFHLQAAGRAFFAVRVTDRLRFFDAVVTPFDFSELGAGQSINMLCKAWIVHFES